MPFTCSQSAGEVVFIPMFPLLLRIVNRVVGVAPVCSVRLLGVVAVKLPFVDDTCARVAIDSKELKMNNTGNRFSTIILGIKKTLIGFI